MKKRLEEMTDEELHQALRKQELGLMVFVVIVILLSLVCITAPKWIPYFLN